MNFGKKWVMPKKAVLEKDSFDETSKPCRHRKTDAKQ